LSDKPAVAPDDIEDAELDKSGEVRKFKDLNIQAYIDEQVSKIPEGKHGGAVAYWSPQYGFRAAIMGKTEVKVAGRDVDVAWTVTATKAKKTPADLRFGLGASW
jgi:hypothetical protein